MESIILESGIKRGGTVHSLQSRFLHEVRIPVPSLEVQRQIIAGLDSESALVEANRKLIETFERKIQGKLAEIWGTEKDESNRT